LLDKFVVLVQGGPVRVASLLLQLGLDVAVVLDGDQTLNLEINIVLRHYLLRFSDLANLY
jgi:hypothetical protein